MYNSDMLAGGPSTGFGERALLETDDSRPLLPALLRGNPTRTFWILDELDNVDIKSADLRAPHTCGLRNQLKCTDCRVIRRNRLPSKIVLQSVRVSVSNQRWIARVGSNHLLAERQLLCPFYRTVVGLA